MTIWLDLVATAAEVVVADWVIAAEVVVVDWVTEEEVVVVDCVVAEEDGATQAFWFKTFLTWTTKFSPFSSVFNQAPEASQRETPAKCESHLISSIAEDNLLVST